MPCGGIYPLTPKHPFAERHGSTDYNECFECGKPIKPEDLMFCDEWDCYLHRDCVIEFLKGEEGKIVLAHGHAVILYEEKET